MAIQAEIDKLSEQGWSLDANAVQRAVEHREDQNEPLVQTLLNTDLTQVGIGVLAPLEINRLDSKKLPGPYVLQVAAIVDTSQPTRLQDLKDGGSSTKGRMLRVTLTDGKTKCVGVEYLPLDGMKREQLIPGTKVKIHNCTIKLGVLLLTPKCIQVLGGRVEELAESYEVQQRFGGTAERGSADGEMAPPPKFQPYDPKKVNISTSTPKTTPTQQSIQPGGFSKGKKVKAQQQQQPLNSNSAQPLAPPPPPPPGLGSGRGHPHNARRGGHQPYQPPASRTDSNKSNNNNTIDHHQPEALGAGTRVSSGREKHQTSAQRGQQAPVQTGSETTAVSSGGAAPVAGVPVVSAPGGDLAKAKLLERLQAKEQDAGRFGRGGRPGRRGRRGRFDDDDDGSSMTLEEYEAKQKAKISLSLNPQASSQIPAGSINTTSAMSDEELARKLQQELDLEEASGGGQPNSGDDLQSSLLGMFSFDRNTGSEYSGGRGGRGGRRGGGGRGRGRGRSRGRY